MPLKIKGQVEAVLRLGRLQRRIKKNFSKTLKREIVDVLVEVILKGRSPVKKGSGVPWKQYSKKYAKRKYGSESTRRPVNMLLSGEMLDSLKAKQLRNGRIRIFFDSKTAKFHDKKGKGRVHRPLLPKGKQEFRREIDTAIRKILRRAVRKSVARR